MSVPAHFICRPVATTLLTIGLVLSGMMAFHLLPISPLPQVDFPTLSVWATLPGAEPETMATAVAAPLERQFARIAGVTQMTSASVLGMTSITLQFELNRNIDGAARDVQAAINAARAHLPPDLPNNPIYRKVNPSEAPILILALTSDTVGTPEMYDAASSILQQKLAQIEGVGQVFVGGSSLPAVRVDVNPMALAQYGIRLEEVRGMIAGTTVHRPKGQLVGAERTWGIDANDQLFKARELAPLIITYRAGGAVRLADVARVEDSVEDLRAVGLVNGKPAVLVILFRQPMANIIDTAFRITSVLPQLEAALPGGIKLSVVLDRTPPIRGSLHDVEWTLILSGFLVILVVLVFLRDLRATLVPAVAVGVSIVGTFGPMALLGYSLDNLSLSALTIATGFVVDDAIVVLENITRYRELGEERLQAALRGSREISFTVASITVSLVAVFIPILLMGGMVGRLFREFAVTLSTAVLLSMMISLTTTPMMCATVLSRRPREKHGRLYRASERTFEWMRRRYEVTLGWALRHPRFMLLLAITTLAVNVVLFMRVPKGFFPEQDTGRILGIMRAAQDVSFQGMKEKLTAAVEVIEKDPEVQYVVAFAGGTGPGGNTTNTARVFIALKPFSERRNGMQEVLTRLRRALAPIAGAPTYLQPIQDLRIGGRISAAQYEYTLQGDDLRDLNAWGERMVAGLRARPELVDVQSDEQTRGLQAWLSVDRSTASRLGITPAQTDAVLYDAFGQRPVAITYTLLNQYRVVMEVEPRFWQYPDMLKDIYVPSSRGGMVPLSAFTRYEVRRTALAANHQGQFPSVTISFNLAPGISLGDAVAAVEEVAREVGLPPRIRGSFQGTAEAFRASLADEPWLILAALLAVYIVLGILYESYVHPITILSTLPSAGVGAVLALMLFGSELSILAVIGIVLLVGIVKKNGILMVDFALLAERREGKRPEEAILQACLLRFRPILMTTMAALLGALPLALGHGVGSELRRPLGITIVGGLIVSQALTLYTTPIVYLYLDRLRLWLKERRWRWAWR
jgi:multidrug efflux pump